MSTYEIAGLYFSIEGKVLNAPCFHNFYPFKVEEKRDIPMLFEMRYKELPEISEKASFSFLTDRGVYRIWLKKETYELEFQFKEKGRKYRMQADKSWSSVYVDLDSTKDYLLLNDWIMIAFVYSAAFHDAVLLHASCVKINKKGVAFIGPSGVGKSTHSSLWIRYIAGSMLLNDDQPIVRLIEGVPYIFGTPWSGKTICYKNDSARLNSLFLMEQSAENQVEILSPRSLFLHLLSSCAMMKEDQNTFSVITQTIAEITSKVSGYKLRSYPVKEAAELSYACI